MLSPISHLSNHLGPAYIYSPSLGLQTDPKLTLHSRDDGRPEALRLVEVRGCWKEVPDNSVL